MPRTTARRTKALAVVAESHPPVVAKARRTLNFGGKWEYAPAPESVVVKPDAQYELFIGGKFRAPESGVYFPSINPANEKTLAKIADRKSVV